MRCLVRRATVAMKPICLVEQVESLSSNPNSYRDPGTTLYYNLRAGYPG